MSTREFSDAAYTTSMEDNAITSDDYRTLLDQILTHKHVFYSPATSPHRLQIQQHQYPGIQVDSLNKLPTIASLSLHPVIESLLHILNCDLPSAHFLCRHAEVKPKWESMFVHGILHRIEGDIDNSRAWYGQVKEADVFRHVWYEDRETIENVPKCAQAGWESFLSQVERYRDRTKRRTVMNKRNSEDHYLLDEVKTWEEEARLLRETSLWEIKRALDFCERKFGLLCVQDARQEFLGRIESGDTRLAKVAEEMITGGEGWRIF